MRRAAARVIVATLDSLAAACPGFAQPAPAPAAPDSAAAAEAPDPSLLWTFGSGG